MVVQDVAGWAWCIVSGHGGLPPIPPNQSIRVTENNVKDHANRAGWPLAYCVGKFVGPPDEHKEINSAALRM